MQELSVDTKEVANSQIDPASAESFIAEKRIGERIKRLRLKKSMGLVELGRHTGLSASFLSQLETGRVVPTLRNLARVAMVFSKASLTRCSASIGRRSVFVFPKPGWTIQPTTSRVSDTWFRIVN
jgi:transcriptional regulator with XRE-family HTH domain